MMSANNRHDRIWKIDRRKNLDARIDVPLHLLELSRREFPRLVQNVLRYGELASIV